MQVKFVFYKDGVESGERWIASESDAETYLQSRGYNARFYDLSVGAEFQCIKNPSHVCKVVVMKEMEMPRG